MRLFDIEDSELFQHRLGEIDLILKPFNELVIFHEKFRQAFDGLLSMIVSMPPGSLVYLVGPTGIGKTALIRTLMNRFHPLAETSQVTLRAQGEEDGDKSVLLRRSPPIYVEAPSPQKHAFEWRDFDIRMLKQLHEPGIWYKKDLNRELKRLREGTLPMNNSRNLPPDWLLVQCLEDAMNMWKPPFACIDEVHNIIKMARLAATFEDQMDVLKSIANLSAVTLLLSGTYKTKDLIYEGDETARRSRVVHFGRYKNTEQDLADFQDYLAALSARSPLSLDFDPLSNLRYFYTYCAGCGGTLKDWYAASNGRALLDDRQHVNLSDFEACALDKKQLVRLIKEINNFERHFEKCPDENIIGQFWTSGSRDTSTETPKDTTNPSPPRQNKYPRKPGEINPVRLPLDEDLPDESTETT